ncbi:MAG: desaturase [Myxococcaceae bacterium]|nr:desaturase [Myxococcaceae bacterium]
MTTPAALAKRPATPGRHVYDVIVFGSQVSGVLVAGALAKRGLTVLLVPHDGLGAPYVHQDYQFTHAPFLTGSLDKIAPLEALFVELGIATQVKRASHASGLQLLRPREWFELFAELGARSKEVSRALGDEAGEALLETLDAAHKTTAASDPLFQSHPDLPADGWFARWKLKRHLARFPGADADTSLDGKTPQTALLRSLERFAATAEGPLARARSLARLFPTPHTFPGGAEGLFTLLADRARELGVDVIDAEQQIELLVLDGRTASGLRLKRNDTVYRAGALVAACDLQTWAPLIPEARRAATQKLAPLVPSTRAVFTTHAVVPDRGLPRGLGHLGLIETTDAELGTVLFSVTAARKAGQETSDKVLSLSVRVPTALRQAGEPAVQALTTRVWAAVKDVLPFTRQHALVTSSPWTDAPRVVSQVAEPWPTFELSDAATLGITGLTTSTPWPHLFNASRQVLPALGLEGEALAAQRAIAAVEKLLKKKDPLKAGRPA